MTATTSQTSPTITIRPARREDGPAFLSLVDSLADYELLDRPDEAARVRLLSDAFERTPPRFEAFLAWDGDNPIGYAIVFETYSSFLALPTLYIEDLFVTPEARGQGAGRALFDFLIQEARRRECGRMEWVCLDWNRLAIDFYERRDAKHLSEWRSYRLDKNALASYQPKTEVQP